MEHNNEIKHCGINKRIQKNSSYWMILFYGFQRLVGHILGMSLGNGFDLIKYNMCCLIIQYC
jgi:regulation of enolase protein 1 (concanavalin A-like superfamily)